jgi:hypothetical protein
MSAPAPRTPKSKVDAQRIRDQLITFDDLLDFLEIDVDGEGGEITGGALRDVEEHKARFVDANLRGAYSFADTLLNFCLED